MHRLRIQALVGVVIGIIGLFFKAASSDGEEAMPALAQAVEGFPDGLPTIWGGLDDWAKVVVVILIAVVVALAVRPVRTALWNKMTSIEVGVMGLALFVYAIVKWIEAAGDASDLTDSFAQLAAAGAAPQAFTASAAPLGFILLLIGTGAVIEAGAESYMKASKE